MPIDNNTVLQYSVQGLTDLQKATTILLLNAQAHKNLAKSMGVLNKTQGLEKLTQSITYFNAQGHKVTNTLTKVGDKVVAVGHAVDTTVQRQRELNEVTEQYSKRLNLISRIVIGSLVARGVGTLLRSFTEGTAAAREFEIRIGELRTISQNADLSFDTWATSVKRLSDEFGRPVFDIVEGQYQALSNQIAEGAEAVQFMEEALRLSLITTSSTTDAVQALTAVINSYGGTAADAREFSDQLFKTVELGRLRLSEIANTIGNVTVVAKQLNIPFKEVAASLTTLTIQGVNASVAQTQLRNVILKLIRPTEAMLKLFDEWGVNSGQAAIDTFGFTGVLVKLSKAAAEGKGDLTELGELLGRIRAITGGAALVSNLPALLKSVKEIGTASETANQALIRSTENTGFKLSREFQRISNFFLTLGENFNKTVLSFSENIVSLSSIVSTFTNITLTAAKVLAVLATGFAVTRVALFASNLNTAVLALIATRNAAKSASIYVNILGVAFKRTTLVMGGLFTAAFFVTQAIIRAWQNSTDKALKAVTEFEAEYIASSQRITSAELAELSKRATAFEEMTTAMMQEYNQLIAEQQASLNKIIKQEQERAAFEDVVFDLQMETADARTKEELQYHKLLDTREQILAAIASKDFETVAKLAKEFKGVQEQAKETEKTIARIAGSRGASTVGPAGGVFGPSQISGSSKQADKPIRETNKVKLEGTRIDRLQKQLTEEVTRAYINYSKTVKEVSQTTIKSGQEAIDNQKEQVKGIKEAQFAQTELNKLLETQKTKQGDITIELQKYTDGLVAATENQKKLRDLFPEAGTATLAGVQAGPDIDAIIRASDTLKAAAVEAANTVGFKPTEEFKAEVDANIAIIEASLLRLKNKELFPNLPLLITNFKAFFESFKGTTASIENTQNRLSEVNERLTRAAETTNAAGESFRLFLDIQNQTIDTIRMGATVTSDAFGQIKPEIDAIKRLTQDLNQSLQQAIIKTQQLISEQSKLQTPWTGGFIQRFAGGGSVASDSIAALLQPGEFVTNAKAARKNLPRLTANNSNALNTGGQVVNNNNIGDINVSLTSTGSVEPDARALASAIRRELKRGTIRLN